MHSTKTSEIPLELTEEQLMNAGFVCLEDVKEASPSDPELAQRIADLGNRIIWLDHEINQADDGYISRYIMQWNRDDMGKPVEERKPIYLFINSPGGEISTTFALYDMISMSKTPVYGINVGYAFSGASIVLLACAKRFGTQHSWYMVHRGSSECSAMDHMSAHNSMRHWDAQVEDMTDILFTHTNASLDQARLFMRTDTYFNADEAMRLGMIESVVSSIDDVLESRK